jgi:hypothetical protein
LKIISSSLPLAPYSDQLVPHVQKLFPPHIPYNDLTHSTPTTNYSNGAFARRDRIFIPFKAMNQGIVPHFVRLAKIMATPPRS